MKILHVTEVLGKYIDWGRIPDAVLFKACQRGQIVHAACGAIALGGYVRPLPDAFAGYLESFKDWFYVNVARAIIVEQTYISQTFGFTGRPDMVAELINGQIALVDFKTPISESKTWAVQLAAYWYLLDKAGVHVDFAMPLRLRGNGATALASIYSNWQADFDVFLSALNAHRALVA